MSLFNQLIPFRSYPANRREQGDEGSYVAPAYEIKEADDAYGVEVFLPGVGKDAVTIQIEQDELIVTGQRRWKAPEGWTEIFRESADADYRLRLALNDTVNVDKINAVLEAGVLRVTLPKAEALKPRRIEIS